LIASAVNPRADNFSAKSTVAVFVLTNIRRASNDSRHLKGFHVLPIYGGQSYDVQLRPLKRGVHAVVGTPGRVMDHLKRGTLKLNSLKALVLDEADEMLSKGFKE
jgi:superfamily II DNA/RNA helicase